MEILKHYSHSSVAWIEVTWFCLAWSCCVARIESAAKKSNSNEAKVGLDVAVYFYSGVTLEGVYGVAAVQDTFCQQVLVTFPVGMVLAKTRRRIVLDLLSPTCMVSCVIQCSLCTLLASIAFTIQYKSQP